MALARNFVSPLLLDNHNHRVLSSTSCLRAAIQPCSGTKARITSVARPSQRLLLSEFNGLRLKGAEKPWNNGGYDKTGTKVVQWWRSSVRSDGDVASAKKPAQYEVMSRAIASGSQAVGICVEIDLDLTDSSPGDLFYLKSLWRLHGFFCRFGILEFQ